VLAVNALVPGAVPSLLVPPEAAVRLRRGVVNRASMPEAAVHEDRKPPARERIEARRDSGGGPVGCETAVDIAVGDPIPKPTDTNSLTIVDKSVHNS
jgi:hypothetical protein